MRHTTLQHTFMFHVFRLAVKKTVSQSVSKSEIKLIEKKTLLILSQSHLTCIVRTNEGTPTSSSYLHTQALYANAVDSIYRLRQLSNVTAPI